MSGEKHVSRRRIRWFRVVFAVLGLCAVLAGVLGYRYLHELRKLEFAVRHGLELQGVSAEEIAGFNALPFTMDLREVMLCSATFVNPEEVATELPVEVLTQLREYEIISLELVAYRITPELLSEMGRTHRVCSLTLRNCEVPPVDFREHCGGLNIFSLTFADMTLSKEILQGVSSLPAAQHVSIRNCDFSEEELSALGGSTRLSSLEISEATISTRVTRPLADIKNLTRLQFFDVEVQDAAFKPLTEGKLESVACRRATFDDGSIRSLAALPTVEAFSLDDCSFAANELAAFQASNATRLAFVACGITDDGLEILAGCKHLRELALDGNPILGTGLTYLRNLPLESLTLAGTEVGDETIPGVLDIPTLHHLDVDGSNVSMEKMAQLEEQNPELDVWPKSEERYFKSLLPQQ